MILVVGMARSGIAAARLLKSQGHSVFVTDSGTPSATADLDSMGIPYETGGHTASQFLNAEEIILSPGVPMDIQPLKAARKKGVPIISEIELAHRFIKGDVVAITGSNGKTTTTTLIGELMRATERPVQIGGNIGVAMTSLVDTSTEGGISVVEVSSFQLDAIKTFRPRVGVLLNITPDHLDRYDDFQAYRSSKFRLFENQTASDAAVLNSDDPQVYPPPKEIRSELFRFSQKQPVERGAHRRGSDLFMNGSRVMSVDEIPLRGSHNVENVLAAMVVAGLYKVPPRTIAETVKRFRGVEHRIEYVADINGIQFYNDSKATNVDSAIKGIASFDGNLMIVLGGKDKGASYAPLVAAMSGRVKHVLLIGAAAGKISDAIGDFFPKTRISSMDEAVEKAIALGRPGDVLLLSPACASFDMFDDYEHRGRMFKDAVKRRVNG